MVSGCAPVAVVAERFCLIGVTQWLLEQTVLAAHSAMFQHAVVAEAVRRCWAGQAASAE